METTRRNFIGTLLAATASFTILPGAGRIWHPPGRLIQLFEHRPPFTIAGSVWDSRGYLQKAHPHLKPALSGRSKWVRFQPPHPDLYFPFGNVSRWINKPNPEIWDVTLAELL